MRSKERSSGPVLLSMLDRGLAGWSCLFGVSGVYGGRV